MVMLFPSFFQLCFFLWLTDGSQTALEPRLPPTSESDALTYMMELYEEASRTSNSMSYSNTVRSFESEAFISDNGTSAMFKFNLSGLKPSEELTAAYLRMKLSRSHHCNGVGCKHAILSLSQCSSNHQTREGNTVSLTLDGDVSVEVNVEDATSLWMKQQKACFTVELEDSSAVNSMYRTVVSSLVYEHRPVVLIYTKDTDASLFKRSPLLRSIPRQRRDSQQQLKGTKYSNCQKIKHYVRFSELELNVKVVAPSGYNMNYCFGQCSYPLQSGTTTNHARMQAALKHFGYDTTLPDVACAPTQLEPLLLLYFNGADRLVLRKQPKMVVKKCGCRS